MYSRDHVTKRSHPPDATPFSTVPITCSLAHRDFVFVISSGSALKCKTEIIIIFRVLAGAFLLLMKRTEAKSRAGSLFIMCQEVASSHHSSFSLSSVLLIVGFPKVCKKDNKKCAVTNALHDFFLFPGRAG